MKHQSTRALYDYWTTKRGRRRAPARSDIDPADIRRILADTFILTADFVNDIRVRLAGTRVCALFAREIKGEAFEDLWSEPGREQMHGLLTAVIDENAGAVAGVLARTEQGAEIELELLLLPLAFDSRTRVRALGVPGGKAARVLENGFAMTIAATLRKRDKLAAQLTWLANRQILNLPEDRRHDRFALRNAMARLVLPNGTNVACRVIDLSQSGAAIGISPDLRPAVGVVVTIGKTQGRVVCHIEDGVAIEFMRLQHPDFVEDNVTGE
ncbi:MAG: PAS domain-containing protein [Pseudolabrys sp.]